MSLITENDILNEAKDCFLGYASEVLTDSNSSGGRWITFRTEENYMDS